MPGRANNRLHVPETSRSIKQQASMTAAVGVRRFRLTECLPAKTPGNSSSASAPCRTIRPPGWSEFERRFREPRRHRTEGMTRGPFRRGRRARRRDGEVLKSLGHNIIVEWLTGKAEHGFGFARGKARLAEMVPRSLGNEAQLLESQRHRFQRHEVVVLQSTQIGHLKVTDEVRMPWSAGEPTRRASRNTTQTPPRTVR